MISSRASGQRQLGRLSRAAIDDQRPLAGRHPELLDDRGQILVRQRTRPAGDQRRFGRRRGVHCAGLGRELDRERLGGQNLGQPFHGQRRQFVGLAGELQVLRQLIEQADFFVVCRQVQRQRADFLLERLEPPVGQQLQGGQMPQPQQRVGSPAGLPADPLGAVLSFESEHVGRARQLQSAGGVGRDERSDRHDARAIVRAERNGQDQQRFVVLDEGRLSVGGHDPTQLASHTPVARRLVQRAVQKIAGASIDQMELDAEPLYQPGQQGSVLSRGSRGRGRSFVEAVAGESARYELADMARGSRIGRG